MICKKFCFLMCVTVVMLTGIQTLFDDKVCSFVTFSCGSIPPTFKKSFIIKFEYVDFKANSSWWEEDYFDAPNRLVKSKTVKEGLETHMIYDFHLEEVILYQVIHPEAPAEKDPSAIRTCVAVDMKNNSVANMYGYQYKNGDISRMRMYNSNQKYLFGGDYKYAFVKNLILKNREIRVMQYHGCVYDEFTDTTLDKNFFWSKKEVLVASGEETMPVKINSFGTRTTYPNATSDPVIENIKTAENIVWYQGNPVFDPDTFWIPRGMYCEDLRTNTRMPNFPPAFSARLEIATIKFDMDGNLKNIGFVSNNEIWYDADEKLVRSDYVPSPDELDVLLAFGETHVSAIFDINQGVVYYISKVSGNCIPFEIPSDSPFIRRGFKRKMASPEEIFGFSDDMQYKGKNTARDILCNVWAGRTENDENGTILKEFYASTKEWLSVSEDVKDHAVPVRITETAFEYVDDEEYEIVTESNIFNFKAEKPSFSIFDITNCVLNQNHLFLSFVIEKNFKTFILEIQTTFLKTVRRAIADYSNIGSVLLVQNVELLISSSTGNMRINFVLLEQPILYGETKKQPGTSLNLAFINLEEAIDSGSFQIPFMIDPMRGVEIIRPTPNSLSILFQYSRPSIQQKLIYDNFHGGINILDDPEFDQQDADKLESVHQNAHNIKYIQGYSSGLLAGVGIIMLSAGIGAGTGLMFLYLKRYSETISDSTIRLQERIS